MPRPKPTTEDVDFTVAFDGIEAWDGAVDRVYVNLPSELPTIGSVAAFKQSIMERVESGKRPAGQLKTQLGRIVLYRETLQEAYTALFEIYHNMTSEPKKRLSASLKARMEMLEGLPDKVLKDYAAVYIDISDFILPDDREQLIQAVVEHFTIKEEPAEA